MALRVVSVVLVATGALVAWAAAVLDDPAGDPQRSGVGTAGGFAAAFTIVALFKLEQARRRRSRAGWAFAWAAMALASFAVLLLVAEATRLIG
jgi:divalent metal cation (Fe/Co/Zn/Cd) transporter